MTEPHETFCEAFCTDDIARFMELVFPLEWAPIAARIIESGATMSTGIDPWAPRWTPVSPTVRTGRSPLEDYVKSCLYRAHDCLHNLWGLPIPSPAMNEDDRFLYKRAQMCGEVAVLTLTEFVLARRILDRFPELREVLWRRNALPLLEGPLARLSTADIAARLDGLLHHSLGPRWVRESPIASAFVADYVPMLQDDRKMVDHNWRLMKAAGWRPEGLPNARYSPWLDGLELTVWMIEDFYHLLGTDEVVDEPLAAFNRERRSGVQLPDGWNNLDFQIGESGDA